MAGGGSIKRGNHLAGSETQCSYYKKRGNILELQYLASCFVWQSTARMEIRVTALYRALISVHELECIYDQ